MVVSTDVMALREFNLWYGSTVSALLGMSPTVWDMGIRAVSCRRQVNSLFRHENILAMLTCVLDSHLRFDSSTRAGKVYALGPVRNDSLFRAVTKRPKLLGIHDANRKFVLAYQHASYDLKHLPQHLLYR
jgi:hypothetical protein